MQPARRLKPSNSFVLSTVVWLVLAMPAVGVESSHPHAVVSTHVFSDATASVVQRRAFDAPECSLEEQLFADAVDGRLDAFSPFEAALIAGGVRDRATLDHYGRKADSLVELFRQMHPEAVTPRERAEAVFAFMHQQVLFGGYDLGHTDLRRVLDDGRFNCVSATVLFNDLASQVGLDCRGLEMPGHAMSRIVLAEGMLDVENTCPRWFQGDRCFAHPSIANADRSKAREVSAIQLAAMIYYNLGVDFLGEKRFDEAIHATAKALRLDPNNATARGNLLAAINNGSIELGNQGKFAEAVDLLRRGMAMDATFVAFGQNFVHVHHQWADALCREGRFAEAIDILSRAAVDMPDRDYLRKAQSEIRQRWAKAAGGDSSK